MSPSPPPVPDLAGDIDQASSWAPTYSFMRFAVSLLLVGAAASLVVTKVFAPEQTMRIATQALLVATAVIAWFCLARGWHRPAILILVIGSWTTTTAIALFTGGVRAPVIIAFPVIVIFSGWLLGRRAALLTAIMTGLAISAYVAADSSNLLPPPLLSSPVQQGILQVIILAIATALILFLGRAYQERLHELHRTGRDLARRSAELETSAAELDQAQAVAKVGSWVIDFAAGSVQLSAEARRIVGLDGSEVREVRSIDDYLANLHPTDRDATHQAWQAAIHGRPLDHEHRIEVEGRLRWVRQKADFELGADGKPRRAVGIVQDITDRIAAEESLRVSEERFSVAFRSSPLAASIARVADGRFIDANRNYERDFGWKREELLGRSSLEVGLWPSDKARDEWLDILLRDGRVVGFETVWRHRNGSLRQVSLSAELADLGGGKCILAHVGDITERKAAEDELAQHRLHLEEIVQSRTAELAAARDAAEAASRAKSVFLANMSHELRTPMNAIMGMTSLAQRRASDPQQADWLAKSMDAAHHLLDVINDILDLSRIEADRMVLEERDFPLARVIDEALAMQQEAARDKGLQLRRELDPGLPDMVRGDAMRLRQILLNFIGNAVKFSDHGEIAVSARVVSQNSASQRLRMEVEDHGIGISGAEQERLFRAFSQADSSTTRRYGGTGLGLVISRRIARLMEGDVGVDSSPGEGSTFWVEVNLRRAISGTEMAQDVTEDHAREQLSHCFGGTRILVAEDEPVNQEVAIFLLRDAGLVAEVVGNGREAVEHAGVMPPALILMDMQMPVMNGLDATRAIRQLPGMEDVPIIAMTANAFDEDRNACLAAGMNAHIGKPFLPQAFYAELLRWLEAGAKQAAGGES